MDKTHSTNLGKFTEDRAAEYLLSLGWKILARNVKISHGELDIIAIDTKTNPEELVIVEVRGRTIAKIQSPIDSVGPRKIRTLVKYSKLYIESEILWEGFWRIDIIGLTFKNQNDFQDWELTHIKDITYGLDIL